MTRIIRLFLQLLFVGALLTQSAPAWAQERPDDSEPLEPLLVAPLPPDMEIYGAVEEDGVGGLALTEGMDSLLVELLLQASSNELPPEAQADLADAGILIEGDRVQVQIVIDADDQQHVTDLLQTLGGAVTGAADDGSRLQAWTPILALADLAQHPSVHYVRHPIPLVAADEPRGVVSSEALSAFNVAGWQASGRNGQGIHVAVIDGGFAGYRDLLGVELPEQVNAVNFADNGSFDAIDGTTSHGLGVAEIVYDVAPGAALSLLRINTNIDLGEAVNWAIHNKVDIIATSIGWYNLGPGDGTGELARQVEKADSAGILWVTSAGNDRERHWGGHFVDNDGDTRHEYRPFTEVLIFGPEPDRSYLIPAGYPIVLHLRWSDWTDVDVDFNLSLMRYDGAQWQTVARSQNMQNGSYGQTPTESIFYTTSGAAAPYGVVITHRGGVVDRPINLDLFAPRSLNFNQPVYERSLTDLGDAPLAITVGAIDAVGAYLPESYSAEGPTNGPGGVLEGGFLKPNLLAYTNVTTASSTDRPFNGTSAATPHVAGAAALVQDAYPEWSPAQLRRFLYEQARPLPADVDVPATRVGYGQLELGNPPPRLQGSTIAGMTGRTDDGSARVETVISIVNHTAITATAVLTHPLPAGIQMTEQAAATFGPEPTMLADQVTWQGEIPPDDVVEIRYSATVATAAPDQPVRLQVDAIVHDGEETEIRLSGFVNPVEVFLPMLVR